MVIFVVPPFVTVCEDNEGSDYADHSVFSQVSVKNLKYGNFHLLDDDVVERIHEFLENFRHPLLYVHRSIDDGYG